MIEKLAYLFSGVKNGGGWFIFFIFCILYAGYAIVKQLITLVDHSLARRTSIIALQKVEKILTNLFTNGNMLSEETMNEITSLLLDIMRGVLLGGNNATRSSESSSGES